MGNYLLRFSVNGVGYKAYVIYILGDDTNIKGESLKRGYYIHIVNDEYNFNSYINPNNLLFEVNRKSKKRLKKALNIKTWYPILKRIIKDIKDLQKKNPKKYLENLGVNHPQLALTKALKYYQNHNYYDNSYNHFTLLSGAKKYNNIWCDFDRLTNRKDIIFNSSNNIKCLLEPFF